MSNMLKHKGYAARIEFDSDDCIFVGRIAGIEDNIGFHADSTEGLMVAFHETVEDYLATCARIGKRPDKPYSGTVYIRVDPATHAKVAIAAKLAGKSINQFGAEVLEREAERVVAV